MSHVPVPAEPLPDALYEPEDLLSSPFVGPLASVPRPLVGAGGTRGEPADQGTAEVYPDTGSITFRRDRADFAPWVQVWYPLREVGTGKIKGPFCGTFHAEPGRMVGACSAKPGDHRPVLIPNSCKRRECPECWPTWARMAGKRIAGLLNGYLNAKHRGQLRIDPTAEPDYYPAHASFHPPRKLVVCWVKEVEFELQGQIDPNEFHKRFWQKYRVEEARIVKSAGVTGWIDIEHDIRLRSGKEAYKADRMQDVNRYRDILDYPDWNNQVKFSPHSHVLYFGYIEDADTFHERTGWTYRRHRVISNAEALVYYLLSHAPAIEGLHSARPCGSLNKHRLMVEGEITVPVFPDCPECLAEGVEPGKAGYVIAKIFDVNYGRDGKGRKELKDWTFEIISNKPYRQTEHIKVYRILQPGEKPDRKGLSKRDRVMPLESWENLTDKGKMRFQWKKYYTLDQWIKLPPDQKPSPWV